ncbi:GNAT family N-acetyltransferase [Acaricomes phytoseiuli]|uniref:GNAT family N-acetyltransferase n=1 Tax=Acaricomes phytoseiuli TaxID=291968 RepID=UPI00037FF241|nr:GNAT family N-acetyltransferase [Acaricomes phytoseiuli]MCW1250469.1 GNAT family N-acetyltransferase [Acaricomes phytoseiuli]
MNSPIRLIPPAVQFHHSWLESLAEWGTPDQDGASTFLADEFSLDLEQPSGFAAWVKLLNDFARDDFAVPEGFVHQTSFWIIEGQQYLGAISLRHTLGNEYLELAGGHIGYGVRPSARRRGLAAMALRFTLDEAKLRGIPEAIVTCRDSNIGSARTIESCGGALVRKDPPELFPAQFGIAEAMRRYRFDLTDQLR